MAEQSLNEFSQGCQADDLLQNLTQNLSPEAAEHARKLVMAMQNGPEEDTQKSKALLELLLSKSNKANADEKPSLETESHVVSDNGRQNTTEQLHCTTVNSEACVSGNEVEKNGNEMTRKDVNSAEVGEKDFDATADEPLTESGELTDIAVDKEVINQLSFKEESTNQLPVNGKNGTGGGDGNLIVRETEKLPELLSLKANDMYCEDHLETELPALDEKGRSNLMEKVPPTEFHSRINLLSESTETDRTYPSCNPVGYESSSEDAQSSLHSDVSSVSSELSDRMGASSEALNAKSEEANRIDLRNNEGESVTPLMETVHSETVASDASNEVLNMETSQETVTENTQQVLERKLSVLSTGTQTSSDENLRGDQAVGDQESLDHDALSSILAKKGKESSRMPFYYHPEIVMHGQQPFLVLQPVVLASLPCKENEGSCHGEKDVDKSKVPVILPLASHDVDNATKDAVLDQINGTCSVTSFMGDSKDFFLQNGQRFGDVPPSLNSVQLSGFNEQDGNKRSLDAFVAVTSALPVEENKTEGLPEWVPPSELDKAFSAVKEGLAVSSSEKTATSLTFPSISLPNTNPFARDLEAMDRGNGDVKVDDVTSLDLDKVLQQSLFGPPTSLSVSPQGARPKQLKGNQEPAHSVQATNPFTPDLTPKKHGKRQDQCVSEQENEVVVAVDVHSPVISQPPNRSPRHRLSSESMLTLIETTYADTPTSSVELATSVAQEPIHTTQVKEVPIQRDRNLNEGTESVHNKRVLKVPGRERPVWIPDSVCSNCSNCNEKFTVFVRKHHCRGCGMIFCNDCCSQLARFPYMDYKIGRVCPKCTEAIREVSQMRKNIAAPKQSVLQQGSGIKQQMQKKEEPFEQTAVNQAATVQNSRKPGSVQSQISQGVVVPQPQVSQGMIMPQVMVKPQPQNSQVMIQQLPQATQGVIMLQPQNFQGVMLPPPQASQTMINPQPETFRGIVMPQTKVPMGTIMQQPPKGVIISQAKTPLGAVTPTQPVQQLMWVPAPGVQPSVPFVYVKPNQGPGQTPVNLIPSQPPSVLLSAQSMANTVSTLSSGLSKEPLSVKSPSSSGTVSTFTVLPQQLGQSAVQSVQRREVESVRQQMVTVTQTSNTVTRSDSMPSSLRLRNEDTSQQTANRTQGLPSSSLLKEPFPPVITTVTPLQTNPIIAMPSTASLPQPSTGSVTHLAQSTTPASLSSTSSVAPASISIPSTTQRSPQAVGSSQGKVTEAQDSPRPRDTGGNEVNGGEADQGSKEKPPLRRAGRTISWRKKPQGKSNIQEQRKFLAKDLRDLPNGVTIQAGPELYVNVKKMKLKEKTRELMVWCFKSQGLQKVNHSELVVMLEVRKKEDIFPEEVLRVYKGILFLASKFENYFEHGNYLSSNEQFLDSINDAGFLFVSSEIKPKPVGLKDMKTPFLYGILIKRSELPAAMFTPSRLLLRLGYEMKSFPFPLWNCRDRKPVNFGNGQDDRFYHTLSAMNKYLKNSVPEALVAGLYVVKEGNKVILQISNSGQRAVVELFDRLVRKESQTATVPLLSDIPPYVDHCRVVLCNDRGGRYVQSFGNVSNTSVVGLGFLMLHLGVDSSSPLSFGGELLDDGVLLFFSKSHTEKLRQSLKERSNCYFYLGDKFEIAHFELRWMQDASYHVTRASRQNLKKKKPLDSTPSSPTETSTTNTTAGDKTVQGSGSDYHPGLATIDIRYSGFGSEIELLKEVFDDHTKILHILEGNIRQACTEPLMKHANKMEPGEHLQLQMRVELKPSYKKWSVGPSDLPTALIRSLQMTLQTVKVPVVSEGELVISFDVSVVKQ